MHPSRRSILTSLTGLSVGALAGCSQLSSLTDSSGESASLAWLPEPAAIEVNGAYAITRTNPAAIDEADRYISTDTEATLRAAGRRPQFELIDFDEISTRIDTPAFRIEHGEFDTELLVSDLEDLGLDDEDEIGSFTIYTDEQFDVSAGVSDSQFILAGPPGATKGGSSGAAFESGQSVVEAVIETSMGEEDGYLEASDSLTAMDERHDGEFVKLVPHAEREETNPKAGAFEGAVGWGTSVSIGEEQADLTWTIAFAEKGQVDLDPIETWVAETSLDEFDWEISQEGTLAVLTVTVDTDEATVSEQFPIAPEAKYGISPENWEISTEGDARVNVGDDSTLELTVHKCSRATASQRIPAPGDSVTVAFDYTVRAEGWYEIPDFIVAQESELLYFARSDIEKAAYEETTGHIEQTVSVDPEKEVLIAALIEPSDVCGNGDHGDTEFIIENLTVK
ncbi:hypothetical protein [Haladaptatus sp. DJG-WS-42]|uniref:hypothetical protein n=1 Tax=Haladaptatus sp. DJG-WS-42 TaxID=3120516 RepID=UPI0030CEC908